ncbi:beta-1,3-galactosyl-O-glycosyl-glycoprotein beta-1,6-N-acetylglucosaminyltransferase 4 [Spea bombifrons]|uniref:beta-1,3-galactosyl-O-glycosyl-glycoprotein beta-1,6-N-acetylglucosaminyltransferase 4 n=1 Tax=Spea bombifrons TaxID=233779 RepID=UPI0023494C5D|nr:beta-1,3-galactosyl-O-glycosyl-glycoprotein beta-1,6-N-acetylglucosaminyltransferase 4 [Spea bombifrons]
MKMRIWFSKYTLKQKLTLLILTVSLLCILKFMKGDIYTTTPTYYVEPYPIFPESVDNRNTFINAPSDNINCKSIYELEPAEIGKSLEVRKKRIYDLKDEDVVAMTKNCDVYKAVRKYNQKPLSLEEKSFPIAYSLVLHKDAINVERLLRLIYNPVNVYCIHYDLKSSTAFKNALINLASCFPNVFIASKLETVTYAHISRLQADLMNSSVQWNYVINLCGQDMPLKSNFELVWELKKLAGRNMLESSRPSDIKKERYMYHHNVIKVPYFDYLQMPIKTPIKKDPPPSNIEMFVGSAYFVLSRAFIKYVLESSLAKDFLIWSEDTYSPDEHFWATLVRVPGVPGEIPRTDKDVTDLDSKTRLVKWIYLEESLYPPCTGTHIRSVCVYGAAELRWLLRFGHWFGNKFDPRVDPILTKCLIETLEEQQSQWVYLSSR